MWSILYYVRRYPFVVTRREGGEDQLIDLGWEYLGWVRQAKGKADPQPESPGQGRG